MIREIDDEMYATVCGWWKAKNCEFAWPKESLPVGYVSIVKDNPVFAGYLLHQGCLGWLAWVVANPESDSREREIGMKSLIEGISEKASEKGVKLIFTPTNNASLVSRFEANGFKKYDSDVVHLLKII